MRRHISCLISRSFARVRFTQCLAPIAHLIRTSMARNAKQINAPVGAEVFSLAQQQFEKYVLRASNKPCDFNHIKNPYQIAVVPRSREKPRREGTGDVL